MSHEKQWKNAGLFLLQVSIVIINTILFAAIWYAYYKGQMWGTTFYRKGDYLLVLLYLCLSGVMTKLYGGVDLKTSRISELIYSHVVAIFITNALMYIVILLLTRRPKSILPLLLVTVLEIIVSAIWSYMANHLTNRLFKAADVLLVYDNEEAFKNGKEIIDRLAWRFKSVGELKVTGQESMDKLVSKMKETGASALMLCGLTSTQRNDIIKYCVENDIKAYVRPNIGGLYN